MPPILTIDDMEDIRYALRMLFEDEVYRVLEAPTAIQALDSLHASLEPFLGMLDFLDARHDRHGISHP